MERLHALCRVVHVMDVRFSSPQATSWVLDISFCAPPKKSPSIGQRSVVDVTEPSACAWLCEASLGLCQWKWC